MSATQPFASTATRLAEAHFPEVPRWSQSIAPIASAATPEELHDGNVALYRVASP